MGHGLKWWHFITSSIAFDIHFNNKRYLGHFTTNWHLSIEKPSLSSTLAHNNQIYGEGERNYTKIKLENNCYCNGAEISN